MASLIILAKLFSGVDQPLANSLVMVETFDISARQWQVIAEARSNREGLLKANVDLRQLSIEKLGPALRLVTQGRRRQVIAFGAAMQVRGRPAEVLADFGEIEVLGDAAYLGVNSQGRDGELSAGLPRNKGLSFAALFAGGARGRDTTPDDPSRPVITDTVDTTITRASLDPRVTAELETLHAINLDNNAKLAEKDRLIAAREHELSLKTTELEKAVTRATSAETRLADIQVATRGEPAQIDSVVANIGTKIGAASATLKTSSNPFRIGAIKVDLKGSLAEDGRIFLGGDKSDGSGFSVEMSPESDAAKGETQVTVPDVTGLTESAARRVLRSVGLRLKVASQAKARGAATHGQSLRQTPAAGSTLPHGSDVLVVFATVSDAQE